MRIVSDGLILRPWRESDRQEFADMSSDADVMAFIGPVRSRDESDAWIDRQMAHLQTHGFCFWALEAEDGGAFLGTVGLVHVRYSAHFTPAIEVGWRIARSYWGRGYAPMAARAAVRFGFETFRISEIVANAAVGNERSRRVMSRLGMRHGPADDFDHPLVPEGDPLRRQVLYRLSRDRWALGGVGMER